MKEQVTIAFNNRLKEKFGKIDSVYRLLNNHERKNLVIDNACGQIEIAERKSYSINWTVEKYKAVINQVVDMFAGAVVKHAEESLITGIKRQSMIDDANRMTMLEEKFEADQKEATSTKIISYPSV